MREPMESERAQLEILIDHCGLANVVAAIASICEDKASHIQVSYGDKGTAAEWGRARDNIQRCAESAPVQSVSS